MLPSWAELHKETWLVARSCGTTPDKSHRIFAPWSSLLDGGRDVYMPLPHRLLYFTGHDSAYGDINTFALRLQNLSPLDSRGGSNIQWGQNFPGSGLIKHRGQSHSAPFHGRCHWRNANAQSLSSERPTQLMVSGNQVTMYGAPHQISGQIVKACQG